LDFGDELFASEVGALLPLEQQPLLHHRLGRDARVIGARKPQRVEPHHAVGAGEDVLDRVVERVPEMQRGSHVRRRNKDRVRLTIAARAAPLRIAAKAV